jgi:hypothetical protein
MHHNNTTSYGNIPIKVGGFDIANTLTQGGLQQHHIGREGVVLLDLNK